MNNIFEDNSGNPFSDKEFRKQFLKDKGLLKDDKSKPVEDYEVLTPIDPIGKESGTVINPVNSINSASMIPASVKNIMRDVSGSRGSGAIDKVQKSKDIKNALNKVFTDYNEAYGLNFHIDLDSASNMLASLSDPTTFRTWELLISQTFSRVKSIVYMKMMQSLLLLVDELTNPKNLFSSDITIADRWLLIEKAMNLFSQMEMIKDSVNIEGATEELARIGNDVSNSSNESDARNNSNVKEFMEAMLKNNGINENNKK